MLLVTGAAGFIGFHFCKKRLEIGDIVLGLDNLNHYYGVNLKHARLKILETYPNFSFIKMDLADRENIAQLFKDYPIKKVVNLAAQAGVRHSLKAQLNFMPMQQGDVPAACADVSSLDKNIGYRPQVNVLEGMKYLIDWYRKYYNVEL